MAQAYANGTLLTSNKSIFEVVTLAGPNGQPVSNTNPAIVSDTQNAPYSNVASFANNATTTAGRGLGIFCTTDGNVAITFSGGGVLTLPVYAGWQTYNFAVTKVVTSSPTVATFYTLS